MSTPTTPTPTGQGETPELLPCPFCGGPAHFTEHQGADYYGEAVENMFSIGCKACCWEHAFSNDKADAIAQWNKRAPSPRVAELEAENARLRTAGIELTAPNGAGG